MITEVESPLILPYGVRQFTVRVSRQTSKLMSSGVLVIVRLNIASLLSPFHQTSVVILGIVRRKQIMLYFTVTSLEEEFK